MATMQTIVGHNYYLLDTWCGRDSEMYVSSSNIFCGYSDYSVYEC